MNEYIRLSENYANNQLIPINKSPFDYIKNLNKPYFISMMKYNQKQYEEWLKTESLAGFSGGKTNKIWADFDSKDNLELAFKESSVFVQRLLDLGFKEENIQISYSGSKGTGILVESENEYSIEQVKTFCNNLAKDLKTFDTSMYDHQRIFRLIFTKNEKTGLYKVPLTYDELKEANIKEIKETAKDLSNYDKDTVMSYYKKAVTKIPDTLLISEEPSKKEQIKEISSIDFSQAPRHWKNYKWLLLQGNFEVGHRHNAMMVIAATCRGLGYDRDLAEAMCLSADKKHCDKTNDSPIQDLDNVLDSIYSVSWNGGQYSPENNIWLREYCKKMGIDPNKTDIPYVKVSDIFTTFQDYALNFEKNLIKTGIPGIDENVFFLTSTHNGILGQPGSGKTSMALQWLEHTSANDIDSVFYSLDMGAPIVAGKLLQREVSCNFREAMNLPKNNPKAFKDAWDKINHKFKNVDMTFKSGVTVDSIRNHILDRQEATGRKVKLLIIDYLECLQGPYADSTANSAFISQQMKDLANELQLCSIMLLQTQKHSTSDISDPLLSMKQIKGSSVIEQASSVVMTLWREGYNPKTVNQDRYISFAAVKNRFGGLWSDDFEWNGKRGYISSLSEEGRDALASFREEKKQAKNKEREESSGWSL